MNSPMVFLPSLPPPFLPSFLPPSFPPSFSPFLPFLLVCVCLTLDFSGLLADIDGNQCKDADPRLLTFSDIIRLLGLRYLWMSFQTPVPSDMPTWLVVPDERHEWTLKTGF